MKSKIFFLIGCLFLFGCATTNKGNIAYFDSPKGIPDNENAVIYFLRRKAQPYLRNPTIIVNDINVGNLPNNSFFWIKTGPGKKMIDVDWSWDIEYLATTTGIDVTTSKVYYMLLKCGLQGCELFEEDEDVAKHLLKNLKYYNN